MELAQLQPWLSVAGLGPLGIAVALVLTGRLLTKAQVDREQARMLAEIDRQAASNEKLLTANEAYAAALPAIQEAMRTQERLLRALQARGSVDSGE